MKKKKYSASQKDKKDWEAFTKEMGHVIPKEDDLLAGIIKTNKIQKLDLHDYSLQSANEKVEQFINESFEKGYKKILIITGKGTRSKVSENPYVSEKLSILKHSVSEFIINEKNLKKKIIKISTAEIKDGGDGAIYIFLKNSNKIRE